MRHHCFKEYSVPTEAAMLTWPSSTH